MFIWKFLENVVGNAMRYATSRVKLEIWDEKGWLHFMVSDDGLGFTSEELTKATKPYFSRKKHRRLSLRNGAVYL